MLMHLSMAQVQQLQCWGCIPLPCSLTRSNFTALGMQEEFSFSHPTWHTSLLKHKRMNSTYSLCHTSHPHTTVAVAAEGTFLLQGWPVMYRHPWEHTSETAQTSRSEKATGSQLVPGTPGEKVLSTVGEVLTTSLPHSCPAEASS